MQRLNGVSAMAIDWLRDAELAKSAALKQRKPILIDVYKDP